MIRTKLRRFGVIDTKGSAVRADEPPDRIGPYHLLRRLAVGGMGEVFLALDEEGRTVAIKVLHPALAADPQSRTRLRREVETMQRVHSSRVAKVIDFDLGRSPYIVTCYVQGRPLADVVEARGPLRGHDLSRVAYGLAEALRAIHAAGCVHRDVKPANVMLVDAEPVLIDFGIAHAVDAPRLTQQGTAMGSPGYISPEILQGDPAGPAADVFAWAGTVVFAATGRHAFAAVTPQAVHQRTLAGQPDLCGVDEPLRHVVKAGLSPDPADRPDTSELLHRLDPGSLEGDDAPAPPSAPNVALDAAPNAALDAAAESAAEPRSAGSSDELGLASIFGGWVIAALIGLFFVMLASLFFLSVARLSDLGFGPIRLH
jgi:serine/threonine protein kinase